MVKFFKLEVPVTRMHSKTTPLQQLSHTIIKLHAANVVLYLTFQLRRKAVPHVWRRWTEPLSITSCKERHKDVVQTVC